jgi:Holliday junction DNA helicase RuvA
MIAKLTGLVDQIGEGHVIIDVKGVGYLVFCSNKTLNILAAAEGTVSVMIETHVREDHIHLYGFGDESERAWFNLLTTVQGVGAKVCLAILSVLSPDNLMQAIAAQDKATVSRSPGVGPKLATRIITALADYTSQFIDDAVSALVNLGYSKSDAFGAIHQSARKLGVDVTVEVLIKDGLLVLNTNE